MAILAAKPDEDLLIAGIAQFGYWASSNGGTSWQAVGGNAPIVTSAETPASILFDPANPMTYWTTGIHSGSPTVFRTDDDGKTFQALGNETNNDGVSVDFTDPMRKTLVVGRHETPQAVHKSTDNGDTWTNVGSSLPSDTDSTETLVIDSMTYLVGVAEGANPGIFRTSDGGNTWTEVMSGSAAETTGPPLWACDGTIYWPISNGSILSSSDNGSTWKQASPAGTLYGSVVRVNGLVELPDRRIAGVGTSSVIITSDKGAHWTAASPNFPATADGTPFSGITYSTWENAFFVWHWDCNAVFPGDAIQRFNFDWQAHY